MGASVLFLLVTRMSLCHPGDLRRSRRRQGGRSIVVLGLLLSASACGPDKRNAVPLAIECNTIWWGALPDYQGQSLSIQACLDDETCSGEHVLTAERGASHDYDRFHLSAHFYPSGSGNHIDDEENNLDVALSYQPQFAASLDGGDRATVVVKADDGAILFDSVSEPPYRTKVAGPRDQICRGIVLDLDGRERPTDSVVNLE